MLNPYKVIDETEESITYQYNAYYSWTLVGILAFLWASLYLDDVYFGAAAGAAMIIYFSITIISGRKVTKAVRQALKSGSVVVSGGKYSISKPLTIKVPKKYLTGLSS